MVRKLAFKLLSLMLLLPSVVYALGVGDIRLHSALNQPFNAEIELLSATASDVSSLKVSLASYDEFSRLGIDRPAVLMFLKFAVEQHDGNYFIKVYSKEPIREPFLDFLVDVSWGNGQVLREYTVLLDPPKLAHETPPAVQTPSAAAPSTPASAPAKAPAAAATPAAPAKAAAPVAVTKAAPSMAATAAPQAKAVPAQKGLRYGPVTANDTLWSIAEKIRPSRSMTPQQVMVALLRANPDAFYDNNVNRLKKGYVLRLNDPSMITAISQAEAVREVAHQNRAWRDYVKAAAASAHKRPSAATSAEAARAVATPEQAHLELVAPAGKGTKAAGTAATGAKPGKETLAQLRQQLMLAQEQAEAQKRENDDLRKRMDALQAQITSMQRLLSLKDTDLAAMQQQMHGGKAPAAPAAAGAAAPTAPATKTAEATKPAGAAKPAGQAEVSAGAAKPATPPAEAAKTPVVKPEPRVVRPQPKPAPQQGFLEGLLDDPVMMGAIGAVVLALLLLLAIIMKRRRAGGAGFSESILTAGGTSALTSKSVAGAPSEESSLFSDLAVSGMNSAQGTDAEVDPLTEADVYMAYGRYQQAEDLLNEALKHHPDRQDLKVKMLEVYYATKNSAAFEALANEVFNALEGSGPLWGKVLVMGHELCPANPMFSAAPKGGAEMFGHGENTLSGSDVLDIGIDLDALTADMESSAEASGHGPDMDLGVDFSDTGTIQVPVPKPEEPAATPEPSELDFDLGGFEEQAAAEPATEAAPAAGATPLAEMELGDLDFSLPEATEADTGHDPVVAPEPVTAQELAPTPEFDLGDLSFDEETAETMAVPAGGGDELGDLDLGDLDAVGTKLDLAKAYVDMGEPDSARSILDEVLNEGNDVQKKQAQELIAKLG